MCVSKREREIVREKRSCVCERESVREKRACVYVCACVRERESVREKRACVYVCACVCERERECEWEFTSSDFPSSRRESSKFFTTSFESVCVAYTCKCVRMCACLCVSVCLCVRVCVGNRDCDF